MQLRFLILLMLIFITMQSCKSPDLIYSRFPQMSLVLGTSGGFTGGTQGFRLNIRDTSVYSFSSRLDIREEQKLFSVDDEIMRDFYHRLEDIRFREMTFNSSGKMTCFMELKTDTLIHGVRWSSSDNNAPESIRFLYRDIMRYIDTTVQVRDSLLKIKKKD